MNRRPRILLDVDGVIADIVGALCSELRNHGFSRTQDDIVRYNFSECLTPEEMEIVGVAMKRYGFCLEIEPYPGASAFMGDLDKIGDVFAVTRPHTQSQTWAHDRTAWLVPFVGDRVVHTSHKGLVRGDVLIEDSETNAYAWLADHTEGVAILIDRPWNTLARPHSRMVRARSFEEAVQQVREAIGDRSPEDIPLRYGVYEDGPIDSGWASGYGDPGTGPFLGTYEEAADLASRKREDSQFSRKYVVKKWNGGGLSA